MQVSKRRPYFRKFVGRYRGGYFRQAGPIPSFRVALKSWKYRFQNAYLVFGKFRGRYMTSQDSCLKKVLHESCLNIKGILLGFSHFFNWKKPNFDGHPYPILIEKHLFFVFPLFLQENPSIKKSMEFSRYRSRSCSCYSSSMLCYAMPCYAMLCYAMLCYAMLCYAMLCYAMLCYAMLCYAILYYTILYYTIL